MIDKLMIELADQILHMLWACGIVLVAMHYGMRGVKAAILLPVLAMLPRELVDQWNGWPIGDGKLMDIFFFGFGGYVTYLWREKILE
jgi:hypothetical protein